MARSASLLIKPEESMTDNLNLRIRSKSFQVCTAVALAVLLAGCNRTTAVVQEPYPFDYRERHPISLHEGPKTVEIFVGSKRGGLTPSQRADVLSFAHGWHHQAASGILIEVPQSRPAARSAAGSMREVHSILTATGIPAGSIGVRGYRPPPGALPTVKLSYSQLMAEAGPCGLWPKDLGISIDSTDNRNEQYWDFGCATQRNLAAMVANPADLVQPRGETPPYEARRSVMMDKYRIGESPSGHYDNYTGKGLSDLAKQ
jgi:pilus assembly protein CpaD